MIKALIIIKVYLQLCLRCITMIYLRMRMIDSSGLGFVDLNQQVTLV